MGFFLLEDGCCVESSDPMPSPDDGRDAELASRFGTKVFALSETVHVLDIGARVVLENCSVCSE